MKMRLIYDMEQEDWLHLGFHMFWTQIAIAALLQETLDDSKRVCSEAVADYAAWEHHEFWAQIAIAALLYWNHVVMQDGKCGSAQEGEYFCFKCTLPR